MTMCQLWFSFFFITIKRSSCYFSVYWSFLWTGFIYLHRALRTERCHHHLSGKHTVKQSLIMGHRRKSLSPESSQKFLSSSSFWLCLDSYSCCVTSALWRWGEKGVHLVFNLFFSQLPWKDKGYTDFLPFYLPSTCKYFFKNTVNCASNFLPL